MTSTIPQVAGMNAALRMVEERGGKNWYFNLYKKRNWKIRKGIENLGLSIFPKKGFESPTVSCINSPSRVGGTAIYKAMRNEDFELAQGYGALKDTTFRIGNMGYIKDEDIDLMLKTLERVLEEIWEKN
jgi:aspartate aminotransferase-like enzyme